MNLSDLVRRACPPEPWAEGEKIPGTIRRSAGGCWPSTSPQEHDAASRRDGIIDAQVDWIDRELLREAGPRARPRLWAGPLHSAAGRPWARLPRHRFRAGLHRVRPRPRAAETGADCRYTLADVRSADYGEATTSPCSCSASSTCSAPTTRG